MNDSILNGYRVRRVAGATVVPRVGPAGLTGAARSGAVRSGSRVGVVRVGSWLGGGAPRGGGAAGVDGP
ncbi:MAG: hypothetical protein M3680_13165 [Myxococcota bacterium]|nr:hypothetical protein [Myxococcota bacterium]